MFHGKKNAALGIRVTEKRLFLTQDPELPENGAQEPQLVFVIENTYFTEIRNLSLINDFPC